MTNMNTFKDVEENNVEWTADVILVVFTESEIADMYSKNNNCDEELTKAYNVISEVK